MKLAVFNWFGWSILWSIPLIVGVVKAKLAGRPVFQGQGSIRLWLGTALVILASSALESSLRVSDGMPPDVTRSGVAIIGMFSAMLGKVGAILLSIVVMLIALPWIFGTRSLVSTGVVMRLLGRTGDSDQKLPSNRLGAATRSHESQARQRQPIRPSADQPRRSTPWDPASTRAVEMPDQKNRPVRRPAPDAPTRSRSMADWADVERIIPTPAMRARATPDEQDTNQSRSGPDRIVHQIHRTQTSSVRIIRSSPDGQTSIQVDRVTDAHAVIQQVPGQASSQASNQAKNHPVNILRKDEPIDDVSFTQSPALSDRAGHDSPIYTEAPAASETPAASVDDVSAMADVPAESGTFNSGASASVHVVSANAVDAELNVSKAALPATAFAVRHPAVPSTEEFEFHAPRGLDIVLPGLDLLDIADAGTISISAENLAETGILIEQRLREFKVPVTVIGADAGPVITRFEVEPALGVRGSQIVGLMKDLSRALGMTSIRVVETIPGKTCMGLELPNAQRQMIRLSEILASSAYRQSSSFLTLAMGKDITGNPLVADLAKAPHMLVAGTTGSGKSVAINAMILSLLYKATPADVRLIMIDPKMLELSVYEGIPHLLAPVVTDMKLAANALTWCVTEMDKRYRLMSALGVRNLAGFNQKIRDGERREKKVTNPFSLTPDAPEPLSTLPMIVVIIDELADLMMVAGKKIEELIARLAQKARAAGIHLILATQRPSVDVITGLIKANIPTRVAFQVSSKIDSRTILDQMGAEALLGHGDMLFLPPGSGYPQRVHGAFVSDEEVHRVVEFLKQFGEPEYEEAILAGSPTETAEKDLLGAVPDAEADPLYDEAVAYVVRSRRASISSVQRQLRVGYNRAARLVEQMEAAGILSSMATNGSRDVLAPPMAD